MEYRSDVRLKDGSSCVLRSGTAEDAQAVLACFILTHEETDWLLTEPDEISFTVEQEAQFLHDRAASPGMLELLAVLDGAVVGTAGIEPQGAQKKLRHRASFGISVERAYWGRGIGRALTAACIACARKAGYAQLELAVAAENTRALALYESLGFEEYGRNPRGMCSPVSGWQELVLMRLALA